MKSFQLNWVVEEGGVLLRDFFKEKTVSRSALTDIKYNGGKIMVNNKEVTVRSILQKGDKVRLVFPPESHSLSMQEEMIPLDIVYEDEHCLVLNKQPYIPSIPSRLHPKGTIANGLLFYYRKQGIDRTVHIVTRLDKDTSGLMLIAKHRYSHSLFSLQHQQKQVKRTYYAMVHGEIEKDFDVIDSPIARKEGSIIERCIHPDGQHAVTYYKVVKRFHDRSFVQLALDTGRTHQIRVHMSSMGHPLLGDTLYGGEKTKILRQALHSKSLQFFHPILEKTLYFETDIPDDIKYLL
ncbi:RluA family pseudouridine synthase [Bacillus carboniphilus]|uniref:Pseudouridine synthase n=1 Tax=Bacillus carboniphilus TaxID=86663 RepID=A0ABY9JUA9_9BACI|nr:RluA family pseudouridine synthase [Bacillus carboniphilus]WLR42957.1 RluA family pseudouridine synthase [Bacillus carboniphilus]